MKSSEGYVSYPPFFQALRSGAVGGAREGGGIADGDFWIGLTRVGGVNNTLTPCPELYHWTDGSVATFRWVISSLHHLIPLM